VTRFAVRDGDHGMTGADPALTVLSSCRRRMTAEMDEERDDGSDDE
jgi:hypothetical protein